MKYKYTILNVQKRMFLLPWTDVNVALGKTAFQTSTYKKGVADLAVDGNTDTNYCDGCCTHTLPEKANPSWWVDLGHSYMVDRYVNLFCSVPFCSVPPLMSTCRGICNY